MTTITTRAELAALPVGTVALFASPNLSDPLPFLRTRTDTLWMELSSREARPADFMARYLPATVVYQPGKNPPHEAYLDGVYAAWQYARELVENGEPLPGDPPAALHVQAFGGAA